MSLAPYLTRIIAGGGEPFLLPMWTEFVSNFDLTKNPYLDFGASTNATIVTDKMLAGLSRFKHLTINVSLDGTGEVYEQVRVGADFSQVRENIRKLKSAVEGARSSRSTIGCTISVMKSNILDLPNFVKFCAAEGVRYGMSPVITMPPDESLCCFNDPEREMGGWAEAIAETKAIAPEFSPTLDLIGSKIPFGLANIHHRRVVVSLPSAFLELCARENPGQPLVAYIFKKDVDSGNAPYWGPIEGGKFEVSLPEGDYCLNISTKWANSQYWDKLRFSVRAHHNESVITAGLDEGIERVTAFRQKGLADLFLTLWASTPMPLRRLVPTRLRQVAKGWVI
jgi:hypothetical protein